MPDRFLDEISADELGLSPLSLTRSLFRQKRKIAVYCKGGMAAKSDESEENETFVI